MPRLTCAIAFLLLPGAACLAADLEGFGARTPGGDGGRVLTVATLADSGPGSLREAVLTKGPRVIRFRVAGEIRLKRALSIREPFVTIEGGSAPAPGITLRDDTLDIRTHDVLIRQLRSRPGDGGASDPETVHAFSLSNARNVVLDHCSAYWGIDENVGMYQCQDITVQWCILAEALFRSQHPKGFHSMGILIGGNQTDRVSLHHCLLANNGQRNPRLQGGLMDVRNNVIYNWGTSGGYFTNETRVNCVGNLYLPGPDTRHRRKSLLIGPDVNMFLRDTVLVDGDARVSDWDLVALKAERPPARAERPFPAPEVSTLPSDQVYEAVLSGAGATVPVRDAVDVTLIKRVRERTGRLIDSSGR